MRLYPVERHTSFGGEAVAHIDPDLDCHIVGDEDWCVQVVASEYGTGHAKRPDVCPRKTDLPLCAKGSAATSFLATEDHVLSDPDLVCAERW